MSVVINGDTGISGVNGSAATPAIKGGDADTGIHFGTDTAAITTGGTERVSVDSSGAATFSGTVKTSKVENANTSNGGLEIDADGHVQLDGQQLPTQGPLSNRNLKHNGAMVVAQRRTSLTVTTNTAVYACVDGVRPELGTQINPNYTYEQSTDAPPGFKYSFKVTNNAASSFTPGNTAYHILMNNIEQGTAAPLGWGTPHARPCTVSFWVKSSLTGNDVVELGIRRSGTSNSDCIAMQITINTANTWEYKTVTIPATTYDTGMPADNALGFNLFFSFNGIVVGNKLTSYGVWENGTNRLGGPAGDTNVFAGTTGATFLYTGLQVEVGEKATSFEHVPFSVDLARCQRYFQKIQAPAANTRMAVSGNGSISSSFPTAWLRTTMRGTPSIDFSALGDFDVEGLTGGGKSTPTAINANAGCADSVTVAVGVSGGSTTLVGTNLLSKNANCFLSFSADL